MFYSASVFSFPRLTIFLCSEFLATILDHKYDYIGTLIHDRYFLLLGTTF